MATGSEEVTDAVAAQDASNASSSGLWAWAAAAPATDTGQRWYSNDYYYRSGGQDPSNAYYHYP